MLLNGYIIHFHFTPGLGWPWIWQMLFAKTLTEAKSTEPMAHCFLHQHWMLFCEFVQQKLFLAGFSHKMLNTCISKQFVEQRLACFIHQSFDIMSVWSSSYTVCYWCSDGAQSQHKPDWPIREETTGLCFLLIKCPIVISLPSTQQKEASSPRSMANWLAFHHIIVEEIQVQLIVCFSSFQRRHRRWQSQGEEIQSSSRDERLIGCGLNHWLQLRHLLSNITLTKCHKFQWGTVHSEHQLEGRFYKSSNLQNEQF